MIVLSRAKQINAAGSNAGGVSAIAIQAQAVQSSSLPDLPGDFATGVFKESIMVEKKTGDAEPHQFTEDAVPCLVQDLSGLPPHEAAAIFYETVGQAFPIKLLGPADAPVRYRDAAYILSDMMLCTTDLGAAEVNRSRAFAARSGIDSYVLSFLIHGKSGCRLRERQRKPATSLSWTSLSPCGSSELNVTLSASASRVTS